MSFFMSPYTARSFGVWTNGPMLTAAFYQEALIGAIACRLELQKDFTAKVQPSSCCQTFAACVR